MRDALLFFRPILFVLAISFLKPGIAQDLNFYKESITFKIETNCFYVNGDYYLKSSTNGKRVLYYPFPLDDLYGAVDSVSIYDVNRQEKLEPFKQSERGLFFNFTTDSLVETYLQIAYQQKLLGKRAEYILTTTQAWGKAFEKADYQLIVPDGIEVTRFSYPPDRTITVENERIYFWSKYNFMPAKNMVFEFTTETDDGIPE